MKIHIRMGIRDEVIPFVRIKYQLKSNTSTNQLFLTLDEYGFFNVHNSIGPMRAFTHEPTIFNERYDYFDPNY